MLKESGYIVGPNEDMVITSISSSQERVSGFNLHHPDGRVEYVEHKHGEILRIPAEVTRVTAVMDESEPVNGTFYVYADWGWKFRIRRALHNLINVVKRNKHES